MAKLIYSALTSLDGCVADEQGSFDWAAPDEEVHTFVNDLQRPAGAYLLGRRMYQVLVAWETISLAAQALKAGLVDECHLFIAPILVGGGIRAFPGGLRLALELLDERRFGNGMVYLRYRAR